MAAAHGTLLALGDCNTQGTPLTSAVTYPLLLARELGVTADNCGQGMCTIREGWEYARRRLTTSTQFLTVQYGLVDSWATFRGAPYVLYYPDNPARKLLRKLVKSYKKAGRKLGFPHHFGEQTVVGVDEYAEKITAIIRLARERSPAIRICLITTAPSLELHRNPRIERFNAALTTLAGELNCALVDAYAPFQNKPEMFEDKIHLAPAAHEQLAGWCLSALRSAPPAAA